MYQLVEPFGGVFTIPSMAQQGGAAASFDPASLGSKLKRWGEVYQLALSADAGIQTYTDLSGLGNTLSQDSAPARPIYKTNQLNGYAVARFDGAAAFLASASVAVAQPYTVVLVFKSANQVGYHLVFDSALTNFCYLGTASTAGVIFAGSEQSGGTVSVGWHILAGVYNGASSKVYLDGVQIIANNSGANNLDGFRLGSARNSSAWFDSDLAAEVVFTGADDTDRTNIQTYFNSKFAVY